MELSSLIGLMQHGHDSSPKLTVKNIQEKYTYRATIERESRERERESILSGDLVVKLGPWRKDMIWTWREGGRRHSGESCSESKGLEVGKPSLCMGKTGPNWQGPRGDPVE